MTALIAIWSDSDSTLLTYASTMPYTSWATSVNASYEDCDIGSVLPLASYEITVSKPVQPNRARQPESIALRLAKAAQRHNPTQAHYKQSSEHETALTVSALSARA